MTIHIISIQKVTKSLKFSVSVKERASISMYLFFKSCFICMLKCLLQSNKNRSFSYLSKILIDKWTWHWLWLAFIVNILYGTFDLSWGVPIYRMLNNNTALIFVPSWGTGNYWILKNFGLRPYKPSVAVAVAEGEKSSATAVDLRPSVDPCKKPLSILCDLVT